MTLQDPRIPPIAVVLRVISILGMGLTVSGLVLALVAAEWAWALGSGLGFLPFLAMMYVVDRMIPDPRANMPPPDPDPPPSGLD